MTNKFESLLELLINEENEKAEALFHEIVVEKSRDIYEGLAEEAPVEETKDETKEDDKKEEVKETEKSDEKKDEKEEAVDETKEDKSAEEKIKDEGGGLTSVETLLFEIQGTATGEQFRELIKLIKKFSSSLR